MHHRHIFNMAANGLDNSRPFLLPLSNDRTRRKYDCGLTLEMRHNHQPTRAYVPPKQEYRTPLTCGLLLVEGVEKLGVLQVGKILHWTDITNAAGQTMVSSWSMGAQEFVTSWV